MRTVVLVFVKIPYRKFGLFTAMGFCNKIHNEFMLEKSANEGFLHLSVVDYQSSVSISATAVLCIT